MSIIISFYKKLIADKDKSSRAIPMFDYRDLSLNQESFEFINSKGIRINYYFYSKEIKHNNKVILFLPGMAGKGHVAYLREIDTLCSKGYKVLTLDYTGCGKSDGKRLTSVFYPTRDAMDLLDYLNLKEEIIIIGHSMGGFTTLNLLYLRKDIKKGVTISPFLNLKYLLMSFMKSSFVINKILKYEKKCGGKYFDIDLEEFLKNTNKEIMFIQSQDDPICKYEYGLGKAIEYNNTHIIPIIEEDKKHNPNYALDALIYMNDCFNTYNYLVKKHKLITYKKQVAYFKDKSLIKMTEQDNKIWNQIFLFIEE